MWGSTCKSYLNCLLLSQKMAMRAITFSPFRTPSKPLLKKLGVMDVYLNCINFPSVHLYLICVRGNLPHDMVEYCQNIQHSYIQQGVKKKAYFIYQNVKRCTVNFQSLIRELNCWNTLPKNIRKVNTRKSFRGKLTKHISSV